MGLRQRFGKYLGRFAAAPRPSRKTALAPAPVSSPPEPASIQPPPAPPPSEPPHAPVTTLHRGLNYLDYLGRLHRRFAPDTYLEIGISTGQSLALAECPSIAIDPEVHIAGDVLARRSETHIFQMGSDEFFANHDLRRIFQKGVDLGFIDGMHLFEYALRDFINLERFCHPRSIIAIHDCCPVNAEMALRHPNYETRKEQAWRLAWTGDVWKLLPILRQYRPDLEILVLDARPTGLVVAHKLDPSSTVLSEKYEDIVARFSMDIDEERLQRFREEFPTLDSAGAFSPEALCDYLARLEGRPAAV